MIEAVRTEPIWFQGFGDLGFGVQGADWKDGEQHFQSALRISHSIRMEPCCEEGFLSLCLAVVAYTVEL